MARRSLPEVNAGSMADIAFLLLIFFLVTTTMDIDTGIIRRLPPPIQGDVPPMEINERNVFVVLVNKDNQVAIKGSLVDVEMIRGQVKEFFTNPTGNPKLSEQIPVQKRLDEELSKEEPDMTKVETFKAIIEQIGPDVTITKGIVSLQNDRVTKYKVYLLVQNEIVGAINELRDELAKQVWDKPFDNLPEHQQELIRTIYPFAISEAEPRSLKKN